MIAGFQLAVIQVQIRLPRWVSVVLVTAVPAAAIAVLLIGHDACLARRLLREEAIRDGEVLSEPILLGLKRSLRQGVEAAQETVEVGARGLAVEQVTLIDGDGKVIASNRHDWIGRDESAFVEAEYLEAASAARSSRRTQHRLLDGGRRLISISPLVVGDAGSILSDRGRALLYVRVDVEVRRRELSLALLERSVLTVLGVAALAAVLLLCARSLLAQRLRQAAEYARAVGEGWPGPPPRPGSGPAMDLLVREVGRLGSDLREKDAALRTVEDQLREARRAAGVASRVNALAHDLNNLLTGILGYARVVLDRVGPGDPIRRQLAIIENVAQRAVDLTGGLVSSHPLPDAAAAAAPTPAAGLQLPGASVIGGDAAPSAGLAAPVAPDPLPDEVASATILAVDDESTVLALAKDVLEMHGHRVLTARNGEEALRVFRAHQTEIDLVLLDLTMPVMGGRQCFRELRRIDPGVRVVISSGFSSESSASELLAEGAIDYLQKPYDIDRLARAIASALARRNVAPKLLRSAQN